MLPPIPLEPLLQRYLAGEIPLYELRGQFYSGQVELRDDEDEGLYRMVSMHLAMFTAGTWPEQTLKDAIAWYIRRRYDTSVTAPIPMHDRQWIEIMRSGVLPWPIQLVHGDEDEEPAAPSGRGDQTGPISCN